MSDDSRIEAAEEMLDDMGPDAYRGLVFTQFPAPPDAKRKYLWDRLLLELANRPYKCKKLAHKQWLKHVAKTLKRGGNPITLPPAKSPLTPAVAPMNDQKTDTSAH